MTDSLHNLPQFHLDAPPTSRQGKWCRNWEISRGSWSSRSSPGISDSIRPKFGRALGLQEGSVPRYLSLYIGNNLGSSFKAVAFIKGNHQGKSTQSRRTKRRPPGGTRFRRIGQRCQGWDVSLSKVESLAVAVLRPLQLRWDDVEALRRKARQKMASFQVTFRNPRAFHTKRQSRQLVWHKEAQRDFASLDKFAYLPLRPRHVGDQIK